MKKYLLRILLIITCSFTIGLNVRAEINEEKYPEIGKPCPKFILRNIEYYSKRQATLDDFKGKWLVLDFWSVGCSACIASFPKINEEQKEFKDKIQFILVGLQDKYDEIHSSYSKFRKRANLEIPCAFDSLLFKRFDIFGVPYILIIDDKKIVQGITIGVTSDNLKDLLQGQRPPLVKAYRTHEPRDGFAFDPRRPYLINDNGGNDTDFLFRSVLTKWHGQVRQVSPADIAANVNQGKFETLCVTLKWLYFFAYLGKDGVPFGDSALYGKFYNSPILEIQDSSLFQPNFTKQKSLFCYSLIMPSKKASREALMQTMQRDLKSYFGYNVAIETRKCPYLRLVATNNAKVKLKAKGDSTYLKGSRLGVVAKNYPLIKCIPIQTDLAIVDETGINGNVDISLECIPSDIRDVRKSLQANGLDLLFGEKEMKALIIRDPTKGD